MMPSRSSLETLRQGLPIQMPFWMLPPAYARKAIVPTTRHTWCRLLAMNTSTAEATIGIHSCTSEIIFDSFWKLCFPVKSLHSEKWFHRSDGVLGILFLRHMSERIEHHQLTAGDVVVEVLRVV